MNHLTDKDKFWFSQNPDLISSIEQNKITINWSGLSKNHNAIHILEKNIDKIDWCMFSKNPAIFVLNDKEYELQINYIAKYIGNYIENIDTPYQNMLNDIKYLKMLILEY